MKRACFTKHENGKYSVEHIKSINKDGTIDIDPIPQLSVLFDDLVSMFICANSNGYGVIGELNDLKNDNYAKFYKNKCGKNQMDIDEL